MSRLSLSLLAVVALAGCDVFGTDDMPDPTPIELSPLGESLVAQSNDFGVGLFARVAAEDDGNLMLSPLSASVSLTMLLNGAGGETYAQIHEMLGYAPALDLPAVNAAYASLRDQLLAADPQVELALANAVFVNAEFAAAQPFEPLFLDAMQGPFQARVEALNVRDPASVGVVNGWAAEQTNGRVPKVLDELDPDLAALLMNALYFKGDWTTSFDADQTAPRDFRLATGETVEVPTMWGDVPARAVWGDGYRAVELPYGRRNFSMVVLVPGDAPLADFARQLEAGLWADVVTRLDAPGDWGRVMVGLPRFSFETSAILNGPLQDLGMRDAFAPGLADLSRMHPAPRLVVSRVKQDSFIEVTEEGTEAAAVTTTQIVVTSAPPSFVADRPFVFAIRERTTNTLLFIGQVADPRS